MLHGLVDCQFHPRLGGSLSQKNGAENRVAGSPKYGSRSHKGVRNCKHMLTTYMLSHAHQ